jgi:arylsulfatase
MSENKNVLLISTDQWPGHLMGCDGNKNIMTPTLDSFARTGVRFSNCYSTCPICIPARRSLMTSLFPKSHGDRVYSDLMEMPKVTTLAQAFRNAGYQAYATGKLHVYPQRNRIGFDDVILTEEGRYELGAVDDYQIWLGEHGYTGEEYMHAMGNNSYYTRPWHLEEKLHPTCWITREMARIMKRKDPTRPAFFYISYEFPHPPLVPLRDYLAMYENEDIEPPLRGDWEEKDTVIHYMQDDASKYNERDIERARKAFYAQCTLIDHQIRILVGTLREMGLLENTIIAFFSDHGDSLFDHGLVAKRNFYESSTRVPFIMTGTPIEKFRETVRDDIVCLEDIMPTLLGACDIPVPDTCEGLNLFKNKKREMLYGEVGEGIKASRMVRYSDYKLIYYPCGNILHFFNLKKDPEEKHNAHGEKIYKEIEDKMINWMINSMYGSDMKWIKDGNLTGFSVPGFVSKAEYTLYNQRGYHWPPPEAGYSAIGTNA